MLIVEAARCRRTALPARARCAITMPSAILTLAEARKPLRACTAAVAQRPESARTAVPHSVKTLLAAYTPGACPVRIATAAARAQCELSLGDSARVRLERRSAAGARQVAEQARAVEIRYQ